MLTISIPVGLQNLVVVNEFLEQSVPDAFHSLLPQLRLAAEEILVNIFSYAYKEKGRIGTADISLEVVQTKQSPMLMLSISDRGMQFDPFKDAKTPDIDLSLSDRPIGGLGIHLVRSLSAKQIYRYEDGRNITDVYFDLPTQGGSAS